MYLIPEGNPLEEVIVLADDRHLYKWMETVFAEKQETETAKTYIQVETFLNHLVHTRCVLHSFAEPVCGFRINDRYEEI